MSIWRYKKGERVSIKNYTGVYTVKNWPDSDWDYRVEEKTGYYKANILKRVTEKKMNIWWYECKIDSYKEAFSVIYKDYVYKWTFDGKDVDSAIRKQEGIIAEYFAWKMDLETEAIMKEFSESFTKTVKKLEGVILPHTKELLVSQVLGTFKDNIAEVAELFEEKSIKNALLSIFKK